MRLSMIVAMAKNRVIGCRGELPWRLSADLQRFKRLTMGHTIIMGRKTYESIGRALPGRRSIVITRRADFRPSGVETVDCLTAAFQLTAHDDEAFVIGGGEVYALALPRADRLYLTAVDAEVAGDTFFPVFDTAEWRLHEESFHPADDRNSFASWFRQLDRIHPKSIKEP